MSSAIYFFKTITVFFTFQRLSQSFVLQKQSRSSAPLLFKDYQSLLSCGDYQCHPPLLFKGKQSLLSCRDNQGHLPLYFSKTLMSFDQDCHSLLCLQDCQVCWLTKTTKVICSLHFKDFNVFFQDYHSLLYISKTIKVLCLVETIKVICFFKFQSLSKSIVSRLLQSSLVFQDYQSLLSCGDYQGHLPLYISKTIRVFYLAKTINVIHLYFSKTIIVFCLVETIKVIYSFTFQRLSQSFVNTITVFYIFQRL